MSGVDLHDISLHPRVESLGFQVIITPIPAAGSPCAICWRWRRLMGWCTLIGRPVEADTPETLIADFEREVRCVSITVAQAATAGRLLRKALPGWFWIVDLVGKATRYRALPMPWCEACGRFPMPRRKAGFSRGSWHELVGPAHPIVGWRERKRFGPLVVASADIANIGLAVGPVEVLWASGKGLTEGAARRSTLGEAIERYAAASPPPVAAGLRPAIPMLPRSGIQCEGDDHVVGHVIGDPDRQVLIPARNVYTRMDPSRARSGKAASTNGIACGSTLRSAIAKARQEVIERHLVLRTWHARDGRRLEHAAVVHDAERALLGWFTAEGLSVDMIDCGHLLGVRAVAAVAATKDQTGPRYFVGTGSGSRLAVAAARALRECGQVVVGMRQAFERRELRRRAADLAAGKVVPASALDHGLWAAVADHGGWCCAAADTRRKRKPRTPPMPAYAVDITPPDVASAGFHVARVVIPDAIPYGVGTDSEMWRRVRALCGTGARLGPHPLC